MRLWAYGTSPHGLGLSSEAFWFLSDRELYALREIQQAENRRWAISQAIYVNAHMASGEEPFLAEDFMGTGDRVQRKLQREMSKREANRVNREIEQAIKPGIAADTLDLPDWAKG